MQTTLASVCYSISNMTPEFGDQLSEKAVDQLPQTLDEASILKESESEQWQETEKRILEQWRSLPPTEQLSVLIKQLNDVLGDERGDYIRREIEISGIDRSVMLPVTKVADLTGYSPQTLRAALLNGKLEGEKRKQSREAGWHTSIEAVEKYQATLLSPQQWGKLGAEKRWSAKKISEER